ncbi:MAG: hypothetical protein BWY71_01908 [Planctomycetes bacterium ADurb.Bin412]|nr:MAG: hypothetical protein BWY71_01908 [Planctomycetes bacterium ADurb.Bin412]
MADDGGGHISFGSVVIQPGSHTPGHGEDRCFIFRNILSADLPGGFVFFPQGALRLHRIDWRGGNLLGQFEPGLSRHVFGDQPVN